MKIQILHIKRYLQKKFKTSEKLITENEYDILLGNEVIKVLRLHLFMQNPKPIKPFKTFQHLEPYVME